jgi:four helix bundle protein
LQILQCSSGLARCNDCHVRERRLDPTLISGIFSAGTYFAIDARMSRDHRKLRVFQAADELVEDVYRSTSKFPVAERYGLQAQLRRAAVSVPVNIVEGSARRSTSEYCNFLNIAAGSTAEAWYLADLSGGLGFLDRGDVERLSSKYRALASQLEALQQALAKLPKS